MTFCIEKLEWLGYPIVENFENMFVLTECMNVTDRQTDTQTDIARWLRLKLHWQSIALQLTALFMWHTSRQELSYRQQITRQLCTRYAEGIYRHKYYTATLKSRLSAKVTGNGTIG